MDDKTMSEDTNSGKAKTGSGVGRKMELLAPAGGMAAALTAFDCGADAVYCGLRC